LKEKAINPPKTQIKKESKLFITARRVLAPLIRPLIERVPFFRFLILKMVNTSPTQQFRGLEYQVHPKDLGVTFELASTGKYETLSLNTFLDSIQIEDTVIDVGAHIGLYTIPLSQKVGYRGKVISFEPHPDNYELLKKNTSTHKCSNVTLMNAALRNFEGESDLLASDYNTGDHSFHGLGNRKSIKVQCTTLDNVINPGEKVSAIKIDVQGGEAETIQGMKRVLSDNPRMTILWELSPQQMNKFGYSPLEFLNYLQSLGFYSSTINEESGEVEQREPQEILDNCPKRSYVNIISKRWF
jgi:FkbM family methyltransferase